MIWCQLLTQICLALSALILRAVEHEKPIEQLFYSLQNLQSQDDGNLAVLEMLTVLPEEIVDNQNADCKISSACRNQYIQEVNNVSLDALGSILFSFNPFLCLISSLISSHAASCTYSYGS